MEMVAQGVALLRRALLRFLRDLVAKLEPRVDESTAMQDRLDTLPGPPAHWLERIRQANPRLIDFVATDFRAIKSFGLSGRDVCLPNQPMRSKKSARATPRSSPVLKQPTNNSIEPIEGKQPQKTTKKQPAHGYKQARFDTKPAWNNSAQPSIAVSNAVNEGNQPETSPNPKEITRMRLSGNGKDTLRCNWDMEAGWVESKTNRIESEPFETDTPERRQTGKEMKTERNDSGMFVRTAQKEQQPRSYHKPSCRWIDAEKSAASLHPSPQWAGSVEDLRANRSSHQISAPQLDEPRESVPTHAAPRIVAPPERVDRIAVWPAENPAGFVQKPDEPDGRQEGRLHHFFDGVMDPAPQRNADRNENHRHISWGIDQGGNAYPNWQGRDLFKTTRVNPGRIDTLEKVRCRQKTAPEVTTPMQEYWPKLLDESMALGDLESEYPHGSEVRSFRLDKEQRGG